MIGTNAAAGAPAARNGDGARYRQRGWRYERRAASRRPTPLPSCPSMSPTFAAAAASAALNVVRSAMDRASCRK